MAEQESLSPELDLQVLSKTLDTFRSLPTRLRQSLEPISVNVSAHSIMNEDFLGEIKRIFSSPTKQKIFFELTETASLPCLEQAHEIFMQLSEYGIALSIDDFLCGHNTLEVLNALPAREIKIDKADVARIHERSGFHRVAAMITIAKQKRLQVTAEGIENEGQWSLLKSMGCDFCQGFWLSPPLSVEELKALG